MESSNNIRFAGEVSVDKVRIINSKGFFQDVSPQVINIQIFEDMFSPFMTGSLIIKESLDLVNLFPFIGEEYVELEIATPTLKRGNLKSRFYIYKMTDRDLVGDRSVVYQLHFISTEAVVDLNKKISKVFSGKVSELVNEFVVGKTNGLESLKPVYVEASSNNLKYISNFWSPIKNIIYLSQNAVNQNKTPSYVFFENRDGFYFTSLETFYTAEIYQEFTYDRYTRDAQGNGEDSRNITEDYKRIVDISIPSGYDYFDRIQSGMLSSKIISYDLTRKTYSSHNYNMFERYSEQKHLNPYAINSNRLIFRSNSVIINYPRYYGNFSGYGDVTNYNIIQERTSLIKLAQANKIQVTVLGRMDYTVGQKVSINLNKMQPISKEDTDIVDKMFSGYYLISAINHYITRENHECRMELIKDSSQMDMNRN